jgi:hypothetical protein
MSFMQHRQYQTAKCQFRTVFISVWRIPGGGTIWVMNFVRFRLFSDFRRSLK